MFQRTLLDSVLYHFSTRLIFEQDVEAVCASFPSLTLAKYIEALDVESRDPRRTFSILPVVGKTPPGLFLQIYQITWLSRQIPFDHGHNYVLALQSLTELENLQATCSVITFEETVPFQDDANTGISNTDIAAKLYFLATRIFIAKVLNPNGVSSTSRHILTLLTRGLELLDKYDGSAPCGQFICWPMLIFGCAACPVTHPEAIEILHESADAALRLEMRTLIQRQLVQIWKISYSGYVRRTAGALERIWSLPDTLMKQPTETNSTSSEVEYDGLHALILKNGLGQAQLSSDIDQTMAPS